MKQTAVTTLVLLAVFLSASLAASEFVVVTSLGVLEPQGLASGQELAANTLLRLEPWGRAVLREAAGCGLTFVIAGASEYRLTSSEDCSAVAAPAEVVALIQQGSPFAAPLEATPQTGELVQMLSQEPCVFLARVSEEGEGKRQCPSGYGLRGLRCSGEYCDDKDLLCCPYLEGAPDPAAKALSSRLMSEEFPNTLQSKHFLGGLACTGLYCDNIMPFQFKSSRLVNTRQCEWSPWSSEQPDAWLDCAPGRLASGIRCRSDYCGEVALYCCAVQTK